MFRVAICTIFLSSSMAEHSAVNRRVVGSSPTSGAIKFRKNEQVSEATREVAFFVLVRWLLPFKARKSLENLYGKSFSV